MYYPFPNAPWDCHICRPIGWCQVNLCMADIPVPWSLWELIPTSQDDWTAGQLAPKIRRNRRLAELAGTAPAMRIRLFSERRSLGHGAELVFGPFGENNNHQTPAGHRLGVVGRSTEVGRCSLSSSNLNKLSRCVFISSSAYIEMISRYRSFIGSMYR